MSGPIRGLPLSTILAVAYAAVVGAVVVALVLTKIPDGSWPETFSGWVGWVGLLLIPAASIAYVLHTFVVASPDRRREPADALRRWWHPWFLFAAVLAWPTLPLYARDADPFGSSLMSFGAFYATIFALVWLGMEMRFRSTLATQEPRRWRLLLRRLGIPLLTVGLIAGLQVAFASPSTARDATVVRVVDGDTVIVNVGGDDRRVRVLNIDTPETVAPGSEVECLGLEASAFTRSLIGPGDRVSLEFDTERTDRYGRDLAHIVLSDGRLLSAEIARAGLGVPIVVGANRARIDDVRSAGDEAMADEVGFFDPSAECTVPAQQAALDQALSEAAAVDPGNSAADAVAAATAVAAIIEARSATRTLVAEAGAHATRIYKAIGRRSVILKLGNTLVELDAVHAELTDLAAERKAEDKRKKEEAERKAAEKKAAEEKARKEAEERARKEAERIAAQRAEAERQRRERQNSSGGSSGGGGGDYSGYTGPRCYAPGGKTWKPC